MTHLIDIASDYLFPRVSSTQWTICSREYHPLSGLFVPEGIIHPVDYLFPRVSSTQWTICSRGYHQPNGLFVPEGIIHPVVGTSAH
jgi:hypothetical protein